MLQRVVGRLMRTELRIEIAQDPYANGIGHIGILINAQAMQEGIRASGLEKRCIGQQSVVLG